jgi:hypothetical protein
MWEVSDSAVKRKWKWQFVNGCECKNPVSTRTKFLNPYQYGNDASVCLGILLKKTMTIQWNKCVTFTIVMASHVTLQV